MHLQLHESVILDEIHCAKTRASIESKDTTPLSIPFTKNVTFHYSDWQNAC